MFGLIQFRPVDQSSLCWTPAADSAITPCSGLQRWALIDAWPPSHCSPTSCLHCPWSQSCSKSPPYCNPHRQIGLHLSLRLCSVPVLPCSPGGCWAWFWCPLPLHCSLPAFPMGSPPPWAWKSSPPGSLKLLCQCCKHQQSPGSLSLQPRQNHLIGHSCTALWVI